MPWHSWSGTTSALTGCSGATCRGGSKARGEFGQPQRPKLSEDDWREFIGLVGQVEPRQLSSVLEYMRRLAAQAKLTS